MRPPRETLRKAYAMFSESEHQQLRFPDWNGADRQPSPPAVCRREAGADERHWVELNLYQLEAGVRPSGKEAVLYCGACNANLPYGEVVAGSVQGWPYCPVHHERPLMVYSISLRVRHHEDKQVLDHSTMAVSFESGQVTESVPHE
jgi:hypothetical protein